MKKHLLILSAAVLAFTANTLRAQIINPGFETWSADPVASSDNDPNSGAGTTGWWDFNMLNYFLTGNSPASVFKNTDTVHSGTYSALIESVPLSSTSWNYVKSYGILDTMGIVLTGNATISGTSVDFKTGEPFTQKITSLSYYYQYMPNGSDSTFCNVVLFKGGSTRTICGAGTFGTNVSTASHGWQQAVVNITYADTITPDSILVEFSATSLKYKPKAGSKLYVDDVTTTSPAGINQVFAPAASVQVYPNPASTKVTFNITFDNAAMINIFDITGQKVNSFTVHNNLTSVNTQAYSSGIYFYQVTDVNGNLIKSGKFSVVK